MISFFTARRTDQKNRNFHVLFRWYGAGNCKKSAGSNLAELWEGHFIWYLPWNFHVLSPLDIFFPVKELYVLGFIVLDNQTSSKQHVCSLQFCTDSVSATANTMGVQVLVYAVCSRTILYSERGGAQVTFAVSGWQLSNINHHMRLLWICFWCSLSLGLWLFTDLVAI